MTLNIQNTLTILFIYGLVVAADSFDILEVWFSLNHCFNLQPICQVRLGIPSGIPIPDSTTGSQGLGNFVTPNNQSHKQNYKKVQLTLN